ncbi:MAG: ABC transporter permease subunit [Actinomycetota bacterium]|jgi:ABC-2 type transport system permease protein|nr:ABC transporter permease subunit [Actinomycetota bacterium]
MLRREAGSAHLHSVFERTLDEERRALLGWSLGMVALAGTMLALYPTVHGNAQISKLLDSYPQAFKSFFGVADYTTGPGYLRAEVFSFMAPLLLAILAVLWGSDLTAGEEERGTIDVLMANPVSRRRVVAEKWAALATGVLVVAASLGVVIAAVGPAVSLQVGWEALWATVVASGLLALLLGSLALALGAATGRRGMARGITAIVAVAAYLLSSLAALVSWLRPVRWLSPWYHALGVDPLTTGFSLFHLAVLVLVVAACVGAALVAFDRRDLGT